MTKNYKVSGGLHGVGISAVNALSSEMIAEVRRSGYLWRQSYKEGEVASDVERVRPLDEGESTGSRFTFTPDFKIMDEGITFDYDLIVQRCQELAYLLPNKTFTVEDVRNPENTIAFKHENGISDWVATINEGVSVIHRALTKQNSFDFEYPDQNWILEIQVEIAIQFRESEAGIIKSYVNTIATPDGGKHVDGLNESLIRAIYGDHSPEPDSLKNLVAIVHVNHPDPQFESQTKIKLLNPEVYDAVADCVRDMLAENMDILAQIQGYFRI